MPFHLLGISTQENRALDPSAGLLLRGFEVATPWPVAELLAAHGTEVIGVWHSARSDGVEYILVDGPIDQEAAAGVIAEGGLALADMRRLTTTGIGAGQRDRRVRALLDRVLGGGSARPDPNICATCGAPLGLHFTPPH